MKRERVAVFLLALWAMVFSHIVKAASMAEFMGVYDWQSLEWAAAIALLGGTLRTIFSLQSDRRIVREIAVEAMWDALKALAAGMLTFLVVEAVRSSGFAMPSEVRFTAVLVAGIFRMATIDWLKKVGRAWLDARASQIAAQAPKDTP